jgi:hypothetical protein
MTISDLKAMYNYYNELRLYYRGQLKDLPHSSVEFTYNMEMSTEAEVKYYNVGKQLHALIEETYNNEINKVYGHHSS